MSSTSPNIRVGLAGWDFPHWDGVVYPKPFQRGFHPLEFIADRFDCVEIPKTFNAILRPELAELWATRVRHNDRFRFTARLNREFTHERSLDSGMAERFMDGLAPLVERKLLGCVVMQFPFSFRFTAENKDHLIRVRRLFHRMPLVAELRHDSWLSPEAQGTLIDYHVGYVNLDQPKQIRAAGPASELTTGIGYVKLHGSQCGAGHFEFDDRTRRATGNNHLFTMQELVQWKPRIQHLAQFASDTYVIFNNDGAGKAVINGLQMQSILSQPVEMAAASLPMRFPRAA
jgi:uncharacterized protein YecE (DUF72 family)